MRTDQAANDDRELSSRVLVLSVLGLGMIGRVVDGNPHASWVYVPCVLVLYVLPLWYASGRGRAVWDDHWIALLAAQAVLTYVPFWLFGNAWVGGASGLLGALVLLLAPFRVRWVTFASLAALELGLWLVVGLPYLPSANSGFWVLNAYLVTSFTGFALIQLAEMVDTLAATRPRLVLDAVTRQRLAASAHLEHRIVDRLAELSNRASSVVRTTDLDVQRTGLESAGRLAREAASDARRLLQELPDPGRVNDVYKDHPTQVAPRLAQGVAVTVVLLLTAQAALNVILPPPGTNLDPTTIVLGILVPLLVAVLTLRHLDLTGSGGRPWLWPASLVLQVLLVALLYATAGTPSLALVGPVVASGLVLVRRSLRWVFLVGAASVTPLLMMASPPIDLPTRAEQLRYSIYGAAILASVSLLIYGLSRFAATTVQVQDALQEVADAAGIEEQLRLARDTHDTLGLGLATIALKSDLALGLLANDPARAQREAVQIMHLATNVSRDAASVGSGPIALTFDQELSTARHATLKLR